MAKALKMIETKRLIIRPLILDDAITYHQAELRSFDAMAPYWSWVNQNKTLSDIEDFLQYVEKVHEQDNPSSMYFSSSRRSRNFCK